MSLVQLSVEEYINGFTIDSNDIQGLLALNEIPSNECDSSPNNNICIPCDSIDFIDPKNCGIEKNVFDLYLPGIDSSKGVAIDDIYRLISNDYIPQPCGKLAHENPQVELKSTNIPLSQSVGVTLPKNLSHSIQIVHDLESTYKPRYKSDYFSQYGTVRKPRYVADRKGNHFVTVKVVPGTKGTIRIDWVTIPTDQKTRYSMPYKFQINNESPNVPDCNPVYVNIDDDGSGIMKLYLVLIKAKQDELKNIQSLQLFPPFENSLEITDNNNLKQMSPLSPKTLIRNYHLDESQLAFTFCSLSPDGKSFIPEWDTTTYSTVLTEISIDASKKRTITCPRCMHLFDIPVEGADDIGHEKPIKKRKKIVLDEKKNKLQKNQL